MRLKEKFEKGAKSHTYQRIDSEYQVNIFLGYNEDGQMSMVITENGREEIVKSSKIINVGLSRREDNKLALSFDLQYDSYRTMFLIFCKDIIVTCEKVGSEMAIYTALKRWKYWKEMFGKKCDNILEKSEIKGLIGELIELRDYFMKKWGETKSIACWMGPLLGHKDFEINDTWYEVKSVNENALQVTISSLEQLESDNNGHLVIVRLEDTSSVTNNCINLNKIVFQLVNIINDPENMDAFFIKLGNVGYSFDVEYDNYNFKYKGTQRYAINDKFPRIRKKDVNKFIGNVKYTIILDGIADFKEA